MEIQMSSDIMDKIGEKLKTGQTMNLGYLTGTVEKDTITIDGVYIPTQIADTISTHVISEEFAYAKSEIAKKQKVIVGIGLFQPSGTYEGEQSRLARKQLLKHGAVAAIGFIIDANGNKRMYQ